MMKDKFRITVGSLPDREHLVAEIFYEHVQWVEIFQDTGRLVVQFYPHPRQKYWEFPLKTALEVLEQAKMKLLAG
jgi:hypothetical protein